MKFNYWNYTTCVLCKNLDAIELALTQIFQQENCHRIPLPPQLLSDAELRDRSYLTAWDLWIVGLFVGKLGWTIIKTSPAELLCRRARGVCLPRISRLAMQIGCNAFHLGVYQTDYGVLLETDAQGHIHITGKVDAELEEMFYEEQITKKSERVEFSLLALPEKIVATTRLSVSESQKQSVKELEAQVKQDPNAWIELEYSRQSENRLTSEALEQLLSKPDSYWHLEKPLVYQAYTQQEQLEADGARLLYFQPNEYYQQLDPEGLLPQY
ncbi:hypothetical protein [Nostoc sp. 'Peltigera membranacea cyanobiont' 232]|uniref:hypothetical protein n=1 Tax=Nostoc sp. 'Peltigera membranacea cyanobiont' 232 TaxID=2014531 RepID=UPI000B957DDF|nr:hypothetical protein [Nostoc sp. 'Peltigera membranacea cyanobiont' 232]OYE06629.1 hypothetical protein CDG79_01285 [Nostoc sp. 'Peltigera membranacea cyanobiont' 232]